MFASIVLLVVGGILFLCFRDWVKYRRLSNRRVRRHLARAKKALVFNNYEKAEKALIPLYQNGLGGKELWLLYAKVLRGTSRFEEARRFIRFGSRKYSDDLRFKLEEGRYYLAVKKPKKALNAINQCVPILRDETDFLSWSTALFGCGYFEQCHSILEPFLLSTTNVDVLQLGADLFYKVDNVEKAALYYAKGAEKGENRRYLLRQLAACRRKLGEVSEAEKIYRSLLEKNKSDQEALLGLGACYQELGYFQKAFSLYQANEALEKEHPELLTQMGIMALQTKRFVIAEKCFVKVLQLCSATPKLLSYLGYSYECQQKWTHAEELYLEMTQNYPEHPNGYRALAWLFGVGLSQTLNPDQGVAFANTALKLLSDPLSWEILSACLARAGKFQKAHQIQQNLFATEECSQTRARRQEAMRTLRKHLPLEQTHLPRTKVA